MSLHPTVLWAQRPELLLITIPLQDATDVAIKVNGDQLSFSASSAGKTYSCSLTLFAAIVSEESSNITRPRQIELKLQKKEASKEYWPRLTQAKAKSSYIQIDWNRWKDEDDDGAKNEDLGDFGGGGMGGFDMQQMLAQMGGGGGMGGAMGDFDAAPKFGSAAGQQTSDPSSKEEDEDMPALENE
jgi:hypothetical protein